MKPVACIAAVARNGVIGHKGRLPWPHIRLDWEHLLESVRGGVWIVGRKSYGETGAFPTAASTIVLSRDPGASFPDATAAHSLAEALRAAQAPGTPGGAVWIGGGEGVFLEAFEVATRLVLTTVDADFEGDRVLPPWQHRFPRLVSRRDAVDPSGLRLRFEVFEAGPADVEEAPEGSCWQLHREACDRGEDTYVDPATGYTVFTELSAARRGKCCGGLCPPRGQWRRRAELAAPQPRVGIARTTLPAC